MIVKQKKTLKNKFSLNLASYAYSQAITLAFQLLLVPFYLRSWGTILYGEWLVLTGILAMLALLDLGVAQVSSSKATIAAGGGNWHYARQIMQTAFLFTLLIFLVLEIILYTLNQIINWQSLLKLTLISNQDACDILYLLGGVLGVQLLTSVLDGLFRIIDRTSLGTFILANRRTLEIIVTIFVLINNGSPLQLVLFQLIAQVLYYFSCSIIVHRMSPTNFFGVSHSSMKEFKQIFKPAIAYVSIPFSQMITLQGGVQLINQLSDAKTIVAYSMSRTLMRLIIQLGIVTSNALKPELSRLIGSGLLHDAQEFTYKISRNIKIIASVMYVSLLIIGPYLIELWSHGSVYLSRIELSIIGVHALVNVFWFVPATQLLAANKHKEIAFLYLLSSFFAILIWVVLKNNIPPFLGACFLLAFPEIIVFLFFYAKPKKG